MKNNKDSGAPSEGLADIRQKLAVAIRDCRSGHTTELIQPTPVVRDADGFWTHPAIPDFDEDEAAWEAWKQFQRIQLTYALLESEDDDHPAYARYFEQADSNVSDWSPEPPAAGAGWFTLSIHDTEDGPAWVWARRSDSNETKGDDQ